MSKSRSNGAPGQGAYPPFLRICQIDAILQAGKHPTVQELEVELEVSERTVQRTLRYMQESMNLPIDYDPKVGGWRYMRKTVQLPGVQIGKEEMLALMVTRRAIEAQRDPGLAKMVQKALNCIATHMGKAFAEECKAMDSVISYRGSSRKVRDESDPYLFPVLVTAACRREEVEIMYFSPKDGSTRSRTLQPLHLFLLDEKWYLFCRYQGETIIRRLLLGRMSQIRCTGRKFRRPAKFDPEKELENSVGIYGAGEAVNVRLRLKGRVAWHLDERPLHKSQKIVFNREDDSAELTVNIGITPDLEGIILRWGSRIEVLEPLSLRETVLQHAREIVGRG